MKNTGYTKIAVGLATACLLLAAAENALRLVRFSDHTPSLQLYYPYITGFAGTLQFRLKTLPAPPGYIWISEPDTPFTDRHGFRKPGVPFDKSPGRIRIAFIGGSTTQGGYKPYPERAVQLLNEASGLDRYEGLNVACSSYSTHQGLIALERWVLPRDPDVVLIYHGWNDVETAPDGYSDREKDDRIRASGEPRLPRPRLLDSLRLYDAVKTLVHKADTSWPRRRVSTRDFEANLDAMAEACGQAGVRVLIMIRPSRTDLDGTVLTAEQQTAYAANAAEVMRIQRAVASRHDHVDTIDGASALNGLQAAMTDLPVFRRDACHIYEYPEEILAQHVARAIAPELSGVIDETLTSEAYVTRVARELIDAVSPREAAMLLQHHIESSGQPATAQVRRLLDVAQREFEFADRFREGRTAGELPTPEARLAALEECLRMKPNDRGTQLQIQYNRNPPGIENY